MQRGIQSCPNTFSDFGRGGLEGQWPGSRVLRRGTYLSCAMPRELPPCDRLDLTGFLKRKALQDLFWPSTTMATFVDKSCPQIGQRLHSPALGIYQASRILFLRSCQPYVVGLELELCGWQWEATGIPPTFALERQQRTVPFLAECQSPDTRWSFPLSCTLKFPLLRNFEAQVQETNLVSWARIPFGVLM